MWRWRFVGDVSAERGAKSDQIATQAIKLPTHAEHQLILHGDCGIERGEAVIDEGETHLKLGQAFFERTHARGSSSTR